MKGLSGKRGQLLPAQVVVGISLVLVGLLLLLYLAWLWSSYQHIQQEKEYLAPRLARLEGLMAMQAEIGQAAQQAQQEMQTLLHRHGEPGLIAADVQQHLRREFSEAGLSVTGSRILPVEEGDGLTHIRIEFTASGGMEALTRALQSVAGMRPLVIFNSVHLQPAHPRRGEPAQMVAVRMELLTLRTLP